MSAAVDTKVVGPTNHRGARVRVKGSAGTKFYPWDHALGVYANHAKAALAYIREKRILESRLGTISASTEDGWVFVPVWRDQIEPMLNK